MSGFASGISGQVTASGAIADEFFSVATTALLADADQRTVADPNPTYPHVALQQARMNLLQAIVALQQYAPAPRARIGELFALVGYVELFLAENMCSGIPLGALSGGRPVYGQPLTTVQMGGRAVADFDSALVYSVDSTRILSMARVGRGRALLNLGRFDDAAAAVGGVPGGYAYATDNSATVQPNNVFDAVNNLLLLTVANREGTNGLDFRTANDPRVPTQLVGKARDGVTDVYAFSRYTSFASAIVLASGTEARLIEAEAKLRAGDAAGALDGVNALRSATPGLAPLPLEATAAGRVDQLFRERAFWLFATGHRHGDLRRLVRQYGRGRETVFPTGPYKSGSVYGTDVTFAPDGGELNNPNYLRCGSREP
jgi:hypothetical protein